MAKLSPDEKRALNNARMRALYKTPKQKDYQKNLKLVKAYGITLKEYRDFLNFCGDVCGICETVCPSGRSLAVDHDHSNGVIRGLLCINCNKGLGNFKDNPQLLAVAIDYLSFYKEALEENHAANSVEIKQSLQEEYGDRNEQR